MGSSWDRAEFALGTSETQKINCYEIRSIDANVTWLQRD
jgi:hypothetical protein